MGEVLWITFLWGIGEIDLFLLTIPVTICGMNAKSVSGASDKNKDVYSRPNETMGLAPRTKGDKLTEMIKKLYAVVLLVSQEQGDCEEYSVPLGQLVLRANIDSKNTKLIRSHLESMRRFSVTWNTRKADEAEWRNSGLLKEVWITQGQGKAAMVGWELSKKIRERLIDPDSFFTRLSLQMMTSLRSGSSITLYEICAQYATNDHDGEGGLTRRAQFEWWQPRLSGSLDDDQRQEYKYFKRDQLIPAIKEINEITDIDVELVEHRTGRKIEEIQFRVRKKEKARAASLAAAIVADPLLDRMVALGLARKAAEKLRQHEDPELLARTAELTEQRIRKGPPVASPAGYFSKAVSEKWVLASTPDVRPGQPLGMARAVHGAARQAAPTHAEKATMADAPSEKLARWEENYESYRRASDAEQAQLLAAYVSENGNAFAQEVRKNGLFKRLVRVDFGEWLTGKI